MPILILSAPTGIVDQSGNGNDGVYNNGATTIADTNFGGTEAYVFNGASQTITVDSPVPEPTVNLSFGFWFRVDAGGTQFIIGKGDFNWGLQVTRTAFYFYLETSATNISYTSIVNDGLWKHLAITKSGPDSFAKAYLNGVPVVVSEVTPKPNYNMSNTDNFYMGGKPYGAFVSYLVGRMDTVIVQSTVWTPQQVAALATSRNAGLPGEGGGAGAGKLIQPLTKELVQPIINPLIG